MSRPSLLHRFVFFIPHPASVFHLSFLLSQGASDAPRGAFQIRGSSAAAGSHTQHQEEDGRDGARVFAREREGRYIKELKLPDRNLRGSTNSTFFTI